MSTQDPTTLVTVIATMFGAGGFFTWVAKLWAQIRREEIQAKREEAAQQRAHSERLLEQTRADNARMVEALLAQARSNAELAGRLDQLAGNLNTLIDLGADDDTRRVHRRAT